MAFCDSDWASDLDDRRSTSRNCIILGSNPITWSSKKQDTVSRSSTKAENRSLATVITDVMWLQSLLSELKVKQRQIPIIHCDNLGTVLLSANPILHARTKHMGIDVNVFGE